MLVIENRYIVLSYITHPSIFSFLTQINHILFMYNLISSHSYDHPFPKRQILNSSKRKEFADDRNRLDKNGRNLYKWVENTVGNGEIARYEQFLHFPQYFQETCSADR